MNTEYALNQLSAALEFVGKSILDTKLSKDDTENLGCLMLVLSEYAYTLNKELEK